MGHRFALGLFAVCCFAGCKNSDNVFPAVLPTYVNVVNASGDTLNYYLNGTRQNNASSLYPGGATLYLTEPAGKQNYQFKKAGTPNVLFSLPLNLPDSINTSIYITTGMADGAFTTTDILIPDTVKTDTAIMQFRFVHASPDAGSLTLNIGSKQYISSAAYKSSSAFIKAPSGLQEIRVYVSGSLVPAIDKSLTFLPGKIYTIVAKGSLTGTGTSAFSLNLINNY